MEFDRGRGGESADGGMMRALELKPSATHALAPSFQWLVWKCVELHTILFCALR